jgi:hypothetical protein
VHVLHRHEQRTLGLTEVEHLDDVRMLEQDRDAGLVDKQAHELLILRQLVEDLLDDKRLLKASEPVGTGTPNLCHPSDGDPLHEVVVPELLDRLLVCQSAPLRPPILPRFVCRAPR